MRWSILSDIFGSSYSDSYDLLYEEKDYDAECDVLERIFREYGEKPITSILDLGCGTGNYALRLAQRRYEVWGVDLSESMLEIAREKIRNTHATIEFFHSDISSIQLDRQFDAAIMMFAVLGYQNTNEQIIKTLKNINTHLNTGGLLIFDVWYGPAVLLEKPQEKCRVIHSGKDTVIRVTRPQLDTFNQFCDVRFNLYHIRDGEPVIETDEVHRMRFFFAQELSLILEFTGFEVVRIGQFLDFKQDPTDNSWNIVVVARKK
jgi:SAM-dependent methyltransferase